MELIKGKPVKPTIPEVKPLIQALYASPGLGQVGCCLHCVLDDQNVRDGDVLAAETRAVEVNHPECQKIARLLMQMSKTQRLKLASGH